MLRATGSPMFHKFPMTLRQRFWSTGVLMISFFTISPEDTTSPSKVPRRFDSPPRQSYACLTIDWISGTEVIGACGSILV